MANETTSTSANDLYPASVVHTAVLAEARPQMLPYESQLMWGSGGGSLIRDFPVQDDPGAAAALTEGSDASNTSLTTSKASATAVEQGIMATVTDRLASISIVDAMDHFASVLGRSLAERYNDLVAALLGAFSNVTGSSGTDFTVIQFITACANLAGREAVGTLVADLHPQQVLDLVAGSGNTPGGIFTALSSGSNFYANPQLNQTIAQDRQATGTYVGELFNVAVFQSTSVPTANAGADRAGAIFVAGEALAGHELWGPRTELQRDASLRATEIVVTSCTGVVERRDAWGESIITDA